MIVTQEVVCPTGWARIYIAGPIEVAKQLLRAECMREGLCVTVESTTYIYTGGEESGYVVGLVNYPRFPSDQASISARALSILHLLLEGTHQHSAMLIGPDESRWVSRRDQR